VSGEHAQVVTILADSFLEDLGSTNGTLVNGKSIVKHFLADYDQIDIGRQRLTYVSNDEVKVEPLPPDLTRSQIRGLSEKVEPAARAVPQIDVPAAGDRRPQFGVRGSPIVADPERNIRPGPTLGVALKSAIGVEDLLASGPNPAPAAARVPPVVTASAPPTPPSRAKSGASVKVLSGASQGRSVPFPGPELTVGRVGVQVAIVRKVEAGFILIPVEGKDAPRINGAAVAPEGSPLHPGDTFEVAGVRLELAVSDVAT
jgi:hypothetical protein